MKAIGNWLLGFMGKCAQALLRLALFIIGSGFIILGKVAEQLGEEIKRLGK